MKTILTLFVLFFWSFVSFNTYAGLFDKTICLETDSQFREGLIHLPNKNKPFTGNILCEYENGQKKIKGEVKDGKIDGKLFMWYKNGQKKVEATFEGSGEYVAFLPSEHGAVTAWDAHGNLQSEGEFIITCFNFINSYYFKGNKIISIDMIGERNNKKLLTEGSISYHKNGKLRSEEWKVAERDWVYISYTENGQKDMQTEWSYTSDHPKGIALVQGWYENGQIMYEGNILPGNQFVGIYTEWHDNGKKSSEVHLEDDEITYYKEWNRNGELINSSE